MAAPSPEPIITAIPRRPSQSDGLRNVSRLESTAEEISQGGSDVAEEIRKMNESSRNASIRSSHREDRPLPRRYGSGRSRNNSYGNQNSIVDLNGNARWAGYSPTGFVASPTGSVRSRASRTQVSLHRITSNSKSSRMAMVEPLQEGRPLDSPLAPSNASMYSQEQHLSREPSQSSFSRRYDMIANEIEQSLQNIPPVPSAHQDNEQFVAHQYDPSIGVDRRQSTDTFQEAQIAFRDFDGVHFDPDREEYVELDEEGHEVRRVSARSSSGTLMNAASMLRMPRASRPISYGVPPPRDNMVYYPAPVPRMLNLPKRLSQQPPLSTQSKRRTQMLNELPAGARQSAPWIPPVTFSDDGQPSQDGVRSQRSGSTSTTHQDQPRGMLNERMSTGNAHNNLAPQLRANLYFEHQSVPHDVEVRESAVATLDSILAASATAPVNAFTHHPYAGDVHRAVYAPERTHQRRSTATTLATLNSDKGQAKPVTKRRSSSIGLLFRRKSADVLNGDAGNEALSSEVGHASMLDLNEERRRPKNKRSLLSLGGKLDRADDDDWSGDEENTELERRRQTGHGLNDQAMNVELAEDRIANGSRPLSLPLGDQVDADFREQKEQEDWDIDDDDPVFAQPTTLLAELQVRKAQLKSRSRTAATAFPGGMHSTLLQLDAVEQINSRNRQKQRVQLAWEDPQLRALEQAQIDEVDEDVPLGVLFPGKDGLVNQKLGDSRDWNRPLGLMARREIEDNEPLSSRRHRLNPRAPPPRTDISPVHLAGQPDMLPESNEDEGETLAQRLRQLKTKDALDSVIADLAPKDGQRRSATFAASVLDEFPELNAGTDADVSKRASTTLKKAQPDTLGPEEEETLGQRRARLQRERESSGETGAGEGAARPPLKPSDSLANVLSGNSPGQRGFTSKNQPPTPGTLLHMSSQHQMRQRQDLLNANMQSSTYNLIGPLAGARPMMSGQLQNGLLVAPKNRAANGAYAANLYADSRSAASGGLLGSQQSRAPNGGFAGGLYNTTAAGAGVMVPGMQQSMFSVPGNHNAFFASPTAGMMYGGYASNNMMGYPMAQQQQQHPMPNPAAYYGLSQGQVSGLQPPNMIQSTAGIGGVPNSTYAYGAQHQMAMGFDEASLDPNQRALIESWRMGVAQ